MTGAAQELVVRPAMERDFDGIWPFLRKVVEQGETLAYAPDITREEACLVWMKSGASVFVACLENRIVGSSFIKPNQPGLGAHVANAGFVVDLELSGRGIGRKLGLHALAEAKRQGFEAMQFNIVVSTNERALSLWKGLGFSVVGVVPKAFRHPDRGLVDICIMHRFLDES